MLASEVPVMDSAVSALRMGASSSAAMSAVSAELALWAGDFPPTCGQFGECDSRLLGRLAGVDSGLRDVRDDVVHHTGTVPG